MSRKIALDSPKAGYALRKVRAGIGGAKVGVAVAGPDPDEENIRVIPRSRADEVGKRCAIVDRLLLIEPKKDHRVGRVSLIELAQPKEQIPQVVVGEDGEYSPKRIEHVALAGANEVGGNLCSRMWRFHRQGTNASVFHQMTDHALFHLIIATGRMNAFPKSNVFGA